jgi:hypothetical protein
MADPMETPIQLAIDTLSFPPGWRIGGRVERAVERKGADADASDYEREIEDAFPILESIR